MLPPVIPSLPAFFGRPRFSGIARQPTKDVVMIELLGPQQTGKGLPLHETLIDGELGRMYGVVERIGFRDAAGEDGGKIGKRILLWFGSEAHFHGEAGTGGNDRLSMARKFAALLRVNPIR